MKIDLSGKVVLVTGAAGGIGVAICRQLADAGASVALHARSHAAEAGELAGRLGNASRSFQADLGNFEECRQLFMQVQEAFGRIEVLINNAGIAERAPVGLGDREWMESWHRTQAVNLAAAALLSKMAIGHFRQNGGGRIIFVASRAAFRGETEDFLAYAASKGGMVSLSRSIARAFGKANIASFVIAPGWVRTPMMDEVVAREGDAGILGEIALPRLTLPTDVAPLAVFLASGLLDHCTGAVFDVNAGSYMR